MTGEMSRDRVMLRGLRAVGRHGWFEHEQRDGQLFVVDVVIHLDTRPAAASDDLVDTLDYGALGASVVSVVEGPSLRLIETLAQRIAEICLVDERVAAAEITVHKPDAPMSLAFDDVSVRIVRRRE
jgi:7,8-dihydroneopterin aldolase/epimerase/oxygenase